MKFTGIPRIHEITNNTVWDAVREGETELVTLKLPHPDVDVDGLRRLHREIRLLSIIESPFICRLLEILRCHKFEYIVTERLRGMPFDSVEGMSLRALGPLVSDLLEGLSDLHNAGVVHRALSRSDLFIEQLSRSSVIGGALDDWRRQIYGQLRLNVRAMRLRLLDFGRVKFLRIRRQDPTLPATFGGDFDDGAHVAPEVRRQETADERADVYSVGSLVELVLTESPDNMRILSDSPDLRRFISTSTHPLAQNRFRSAEDMLAEWQSLPIWDTIEQ